MQTMKSDRLEEWLRNAQASLRSRPADVVPLRRAAGRTLSTAGAAALSAFYRLYPDERIEEKEFVAVCLMCLWREDEWDRGQSIPKAVKNSLTKDQQQEFPRRLQVLLDMPWDTTGYFAGKLYRIARLCRSKGNVINAFNLLRDLYSWDHPEHFIQRNWVKDFYQMERKGEK